MGHRRTTVGIIGLALAFAGSAVAAGASTSPAGTTCTTTWKHAVDGEWNDFTKWTNGVPQSSASGCITKKGTYTVHILGTVYPGAVTIGAARGHQTLSIDGNCSGGAELSVQPAGAASGSVYIGPHATLRLTDTGCGSAANLSITEGKVTNDGTITVDSTSPSGFRRITAPVRNNGTLRLAAGVQLRLDNGLVNSREAVTEVHLGEPGGASFIASEPGARLRGSTLAIVTNPGFVPIDGDRFTVCTNCRGRFHTITGTQLPHKFAIRHDYYIADDGSPSLDLIIRKTR